MIKSEKLEYLQKNHWSEWYDTRKEADQYVSDQHPVWCVCKKLCTGLHERYCNRFKAKVDSETVKRLKHLLPAKQILPVGTRIKFTSSWVWVVGPENKITYPETGQVSSLTYYTKRDYEVLK